MATTGHGWEKVVSKNAKKPQTKAPQTNKKTVSSDMPTIAKAEPLRETQTIYDAFLEKERRAELEQQRQSAANSNKHSHTNGAQKRPQKKKQSGSAGSGDKKKEILTLEQALTKVTTADLESILEKDQVTFPSNPSVWLLDLASFLNLKFDAVPESDPVFAGKPMDYPLNMLTKKMKGVLNGAINKCTSNTLELFMEHCIKSMLNDIGKGTSTYGWRIFIQLLAHDKPELVVANLNKYLDMLKTNQNRSLRGLSIMWAVGQAGTKDVAKGLKVWLEVMLPVLNIRALAGYAVDYLEKLFNLHKDSKTANGAVGLRNFFSILDMIFNQQSHLPHQLQKKLMALYPKLKVISFGQDTHNTLRGFFPSFLSRLTEGTNKTLKAELLGSLVTCLSQDKHCFSVWRQMYTKHMTESGLLLEHLATIWSTKECKVEKKLLKETITAFSITNEEMTKQNKKDDGLQKCISACKALETKMSRGRFPWGTVFFLLIAAIGGVISYDVYVSKGFQKSQTHKFLTDTGILAFLVQVWNRIVFYSGRVGVWLQDNVPYYYAKFCALVGPYLQLFWEKLYEFGLWIVQVTQPQRDWLAEKIPELLAWIQSKVPGLCEAVSYYFDLTLKFIIHYSLVVWEFITYYSLIVWAWLEENVFTGSFSIENIQKTLVDFLVAVRSYIAQFFQWLTQQLSNDTVAKETVKKTVKN